jgi:hypothetical protein
MLTLDLDAEFKKMGLDDYPESLNMNQQINQTETKPFGPRAELNLISNTFPTQSHLINKAPELKKYDFESEADLTEIALEIEELDNQHSKDQLSVTEKIGALNQAIANTYGHGSGCIKSIQGIKLRTMENQLSFRLH